MGVGGDRKGHAEVLWGAVMSCSLLRVCLPWVLGTCTEPCAPSLRASPHRGCEDGGEDTESLKRYFRASPLVTELCPPWRGAGPPTARRVIQKDRRKAERRRWHNYRAISGQRSRRPGAHLQMLGLLSHRWLLVEGEAGLLQLLAPLLRCPEHISCMVLPAPSGCAPPLDRTPP